MNSASRIAQRMHASATSWREICELLGVHHDLMFGLLSESPANTNDDVLAELPLNATIDVARRLDLPLVDLVPQLKQEITPQTPTEPDEADTDALAVLSALAHAHSPLSKADLSNILDWPLRRVSAGLRQIEQRPYLAGPYALHSVAPRHFDLHPRLDILTTDQHEAARDATGTLDGLTVQEATLLRIALTNECWPTTEDSQEDSPLYDEYVAANPDLVTALCRRGLLHADGRGTGNGYNSIDREVWNSIAVNSRFGAHRFGGSPRWGTLQEHAYDPGEHSDPAHQTIEQTAEATEPENTVDLSDYDNPPDDAAQH